MRLSLLKGAKVALGARRGDRTTRKRLAGWRHETERRAAHARMAPWAGRTTVDGQARGGATNPGRGNEGATGRSTPGMPNRERRTTGRGSRDARDALQPGRARLRGRTRPSEAAGRGRDGEPEPTGALGSHDGTTTKPPLSHDEATTGSLRSRVVGLECHRQNRSKPRRSQHGCTLVRSFRRRICFVLTHAPGCGWLLPGRAPFC
jgi:hypothetical protein